MPVSFSIADSSEGPRRIVIWVTGALDAGTAGAVRARLGQAERHGRSDVILDLTGVTFVDSIGLSSIISGARALRGTGKLRVISPPDRVANILTEAGLEDLFEIIPDRRRRDVPVSEDRRRPAAREGQETSAER